MQASPSCYIKPFALHLQHCPARPCKLPAVAAVPPQSRSERSQSRSVPNAVSHSIQTADAVVIDIDAVVQGLDVIVTHWAFAAASATTGQIAGSPAVYTRCMQQLLPVIQQPYEAALMLRLLHDEGIVGEYSTLRLVPGWQIRLANMAGCHTTHIEVLLGSLQHSSPANLFLAVSSCREEHCRIDFHLSRTSNIACRVVSTMHHAVLCCACCASPPSPGARSTAGREGPVVGRPVRESGSRPLLLNEILEHWADEIKPTCLLRWSRQAGCSCAELEQQVQQAYAQVCWQLGGSRLGVGLMTALHPMLSSAACRHQRLCSVAICHGTASQDCRRTHLSSSESSGCCPPYTADGLVRAGST
jgi:hypothetical protein